MFPSWTGDSSSPIYNDRKGVLYGDTPAAALLTTESGVQVSIPGEISELISRCWRACGVMMSASRAKLSSVSGVNASGCVRDAACESINLQYVQQSVRYSDGDMAPAGI